MLRELVTVLFAFALSGCLQLVEEPQGEAQDSAPSSPDTRWETDQDLALVTLLAAPHGLDWQDFEMRATAPLHVGRNTQAIAEDPAVSEAYVRMPAGPFAAGDFLDLCADDPAGTRADVMIRHSASGDMVYAVTVWDVPPCGTITQ